ncbi:MAG: hypothetical protein MUF69_03280, partial [Desulfobacterota bacterium]|nr:hypothetical protein [Thermodesulfobacteriota bacterium]
MIQWGAVFIFISLGLLAPLSAWPQAGKPLPVQEAPAGAARGRVYVNPAAAQRTYPMVAVMAFKAQADLVGASIADLLATELLTTYKYQLIDRVQVEQILREKAGDSRVIAESSAAVRAGQVLGVQGVIIGTVPEYGVTSRAAGELTAIGVQAKMIDVADGAIVWSITDTAFADRTTTMTGLTQQLIQRMVDQLLRELVRSGDTLALALPVPRVLKAEGRPGGAVLDIQADAPAAVASYRVLRGGSAQGPFQEVGLVRQSGAQTIPFEDRSLKADETYYYQVQAVTPSQMTGRPTPPFSVTTAGPPGAVTGLTAQSGLIRRVVLTWQPAEDPKVRGYVISRRTGNGPWEKIKTLEGREAATATDTDLGDAVSYAYRIAALYKKGAESPPSSPVNALTKGPPSQVRKLEARSLQPRRVPLKWSPVLEPEVKGYAVFRSAHPEGPFEKIAFVDGQETAEFVDGAKRGFFGLAAPLLDETRYYYKVQAVNVVDVPGPDSPADNAVTKPVPEPVLGVQTGQLEVKQASLKWRAAEEADIVKYQIFRGRDPQAVQSMVAEVLAPATQGVDQKLEDGTRYYYRVRAVDKDGLEGKFSAVVSSSTKPVPVKPRELKARWEGNGVR